MYSASYMEPDDLATDDPSMDRPCAAMSDDWDLAMLRELAEMSMTLARAVTENALRRLSAEPEAANDDEVLPPAYQGDPVLAQGRAARSVRLTLGLYAKIKRERAMALRAAEAGADPELDPEHEGAVEELQQRIGRMLEGHIDSHADGVRQAMEETIAEAADGPEHDRMIGRTRDYLLEAEAELNFLERPVGAMIAELCAELGLSPNWNRWAKREWAVEEAKQQRAGSPYRLGTGP